MVLVFGTIPLSAFAATGTVPEGGQVQIGLEFVTLKDNFLSAQFGNNLQKFFNYYLRNGSIPEETDADELGATNNVTNKMGSTYAEKLTTLKEKLSGLYNDPISDIPTSTSLIWLKVKITVPATLISSNGASGWQGMTLALEDTGKSFEQVGGFIYNPLINRADAWGTGASHDDGMSGYYTTLDSGKPTVSLMTTETATVGGNTVTPYMFNIGMGLSSTTTPWYNYPTGTDQLDWDLLIPLKVKSGAEVGSDYEIKVATTPTATYNSMMFQLSNGANGATYTAGNSFTKDENVFTGSTTYNLVKEEASFTASDIGEVAASDTGTATITLTAGTKTEFKSGTVDATKITLAKNDSGDTSVIGTTNPTSATVTKGSEGAADTMTLTLTTDAFTLVKGEKLKITLDGALFENGTTATTSLYALPSAGTVSSTASILAKPVAEFDYSDNKLYGYDKTTQTQFTVGTPTSSSTWYDLPVSTADDTKAATAYDLANDDDGAALTALEALVKTTQTADTSVTVPLTIRYKRSTNEALYSTLDLTVAAAPDDDALKLNYLTEKTATVANTNEYRIKVASGTANDWITANNAAIDLNDVKGNSSDEAAFDKTLEFRAAKATGTEKVGVNHTTGSLPSKIKEQDVPARPTLTFAAAGTQSEDTKVAGETTVTVTTNPTGKTVNYTVDTNATAARSTFMDATTGVAVTGDAIKTLTAGGNIAATTSQYVHGMIVAVADTNFASHAATATDVVSFAGKGNNYATITAAAQTETDTVTLTFKGATITKATIEAATSNYVVNDGTNDLAVKTISYNATAGTVTLTLDNDKKIEEGKTYQVKITQSGCGFEPNTWNADSGTDPIDVTVSSKGYTVELTTRTHNGGNTVDPSNTSNKITPSTLTLTDENGAAIAGYQFAASKELTIYVSGMKKYEALKVGNKTATITVKVVDANGAEQSALKGTISDIADSGNNDGKGSFKYTHATDAVADAKYTIQISLDTLPVPVELEAPATPTAPAPYLVSGFKTYDGTANDATDEDNDEKIGVKFQYTNLDTDYQDVLAATTKLDVTDAAYTANAKDTDTVNLTIGDVDSAAINGSYYLSIPTGGLTFTGVTINDGTKKGIQAAEISSITANPTVKNVDSSTTLDDIVEQLKDTPVTIETTTGALSESPATTKLSDLADDTTLTAALENAVKAAALAAGAYTSETKDAIEAVDDNGDFVATKTIDQAKPGDVFPITLPDGYTIDDSATDGTGLTINVSAGTITVAKDAANGATITIPVNDENGDTVVGGLTVTVTTVSDPEYDYSALAGTSVALSLDLDDVASTETKTNFGDGTNVAGNGTIDLTVTPTKKSSGGGYVPTGPSVIAEDEDYGTKTGEFEVDGDGKIVREPEVKPKKGLEFLGWSTDEDDPDKIIDPETYTVEEDTTFYAIYRGYLAGNDKKQAEPTRSITRAELAKMLVVAAGLYDGTEDYGKPTYRDSQAGWYVPYLAAAEKAGIIHGKGDGTFAPTDTITRQEAAVMIVETFKVMTSESATTTKVSDFDDVASWAKKYAAALVENGTITGVPSGDDLLYAPLTDVTRGMAALMINKYLGLDETGKSSINADSSITSPFVDMTSKAPWYAADILFASKSVPASYYSDEITIPTGN